MPSLKGLKGRWVVLVVLFLALVLGLAVSLQAAEYPSLKVDGGELFATLDIPSSGSAWPVALIIAGSGPTDRDGNNPLIGRTNCLEMLAQGLAAKGIASLRYDKRGIGASAGAMANEADVRFDTFVADAESWGKLLLKDRRFSRLIIIGHSEGALIGAVACGKLDAKGYISLAGAGFPAYTVLENQMKENFSLDLLKQGNRILELLKAGKTTDEVPASLMELYRPSVQPYLISWFQYDPIKVVAKLKAPCLIVHGTTDIQLSVSNAERLAKANPSARLLIIKGMNHILKMVPEDFWQQIASYSDPKMPVSPELVEKMAAFINQASQKK